MVNNSKGDQQVLWILAQIENRNESGKTEHDKVFQFNIKYILYIITLLVLRFSLFSIFYFCRLKMQKLRIKVKAKMHFNWNIVGEFCGMKLSG